MFFFKKIMIVITYCCLLISIPQCVFSNEELSININESEQQFKVVTDGVDINSEYKIYLNDQLVKPGELDRVFDEQLLSTHLKLIVDEVDVNLDMIQLSIKDKKLELNNIQEQLAKSVGSFELKASFDTEQGDLLVVVSDRIKQLSNESKLILEDDWNARLGLLSGKLNNEEIDLSEIMIIAKNNERISSNKISISLDDKESINYSADVEFRSNDKSLKLLGVNDVLYQATNHWQGCFKSNVIEGELILCLRSRLLPDRYIITYQDDIVGHEAIQQTSEMLFEKYNGKKEHIFDHVLHGFSGGFNASDIEEIENEITVKSISRDAMAYADAVQEPTTSWGIDRLDERYNINDNRFTYNSTGLGVHVYVIDSGVNKFHPDFDNNRFSTGTSFVYHGSNFQIPNYADCTGHGTHVAGTILGANHGVAKQASIHSVKVFDCDDSAPTSDIIAAVNYVTQHGQKPAVVNMSLSLNVIDWSTGNSQNLGAATNLENAIQNSINQGFTYVVSSGNENMNACQGSSPARFGPAITVGAVKSNGERWNEHYYYPSRTVGSNTGWCLDIHAPGHNITSANANDFNNDLTLTGTSMAAPHVTGIVALYLQYYPTVSPSWMSNKVINVSTRDMLWSLGNSHNRMAYWPEKCLNSFTLTHGVVIPAGNAYYDGAACMVTPVPHGSNPFIWNNGFYIKPGPGNSCVIGIYDGANCYIGHPPAGGRSYIHNGNFIYFD